MKKLLLLLSLCFLSRQSAGSYSAPIPTREALLAQIEQYDREITSNLYNYPMKKQNYLAIIEIVEKLERLDRENPGLMSSNKTFFLPKIKESSEKSLAFLQNSSTKEAK